MNKKIQGILITVFSIALMSVLAYGTANISENSIVFGKTEYVIPNSASDLTSKIENGAGKKIIIPCGTYTLSGNYELPSNINIEGSGVCTKIQLNESYANGTLFSNVGVDENIILSNFLIDGNHIQNTDNKAINLIVLSNVTNIKIEGLRFVDHYYNATDGYKKGVEIWYSENIIIQDNSFDNVQNGIIVRYSNRGVISNNIGKNMYARFIEVSNDWENPIGTYSTNFVVDGNVVNTVYALRDTNGDGYYSKSENTVWSNNIATNISRYGMRIIQSDSSYHQKNNKIIGNTIIMNTEHASADHGIIVYRQDDVTISENTVIGSGKDCINLERDDKAIVNNNYLYNCSLWGISVSNSPSNLTLIEGNVIADTGTNGITASGGIYLGTTGNVVVSNNIIKNSDGKTETGIKTYDVENYVVHNNVFYSKINGIDISSGNRPISEYGNTWFNSSDSNKFSNNGFLINNDLYLNGTLYTYGQDIIDNRDVNGIFDFGGTNTGRYIRLSSGSSAGIIGGNNDITLAPSNVNGLTVDAGTLDIVVHGLMSTYVGGSAYVCVYDSGILFASEVACP